LGFAAAASDTESAECTTALRPESGGERQAYTVYMARRPSPTSVLTIRVPVRLERQLAMEARRRRRTRSETARAILESALMAGEGADPRDEARRQSRLVAVLESEHDVLDFISATADLRGWK